MAIDNSHADKARKYFSSKVTDSERAAFEAGIALGMVMHQFRGIPIKYADEVEHLERVIEYAIKSQPFKSDAKVNIKLNMNSLDMSNPYSYFTLDNKHLEVEVTVKYGKAFVKAKIRYIDELGYTLAYIEDIGEEGESDG